MLKNKKILFLGSSVTLGSASGNYSFADALEDEYGIIKYKEAVNGTTLVDINEDSYISRLNKVNRNIQFDLVVLQLSTNDASKNLDINDIKNAIIAIINIVNNEFKCPLLIYTGTKYSSSKYKEIVNLLYELQKEHDFAVLDLWNDEEMNMVSKEDYDKYMSDPIHPTKLGYVEWWTPKFKKAIVNIIK